MTRQLSDHANLTGIEQELLAARDQLDARIARLKRLHDFTVSALQCTKEQQLTRLVASAIVAIFEFDCAVCCSLDDAGKPVGNIAVEGLKAESHEDLAMALQALLLQDLRSTDNHCLDAAMLTCLQPAIPLQQGFLLIPRLPGGQPLAVMLGGNIIASAERFDAVTSDLDESYALLGSQVSTMLQMLRSRAQISAVNSERETRFRRIFENTDAISVQGYDASRRVIYWNPASEKLYGISQADALGQRLEDLIIPGSMREAVVQAVTQWVEQGKPIPSEELTLQREDGSAVEVFSSHVMLANAAGESEMYCIDVDLTGQKRALEQVKLLSMAVEQSPVSVIITDASGVIEYVNRSFEKISGYLATDVIGQNPRIFKSGTTSDGVYENLWKTISSGRLWHGQLQNRCRDGRIIWENVYITPVMNEQNEIYHYLAVKEDISLQKQQEETILKQAHFDSLTGLPNRFLCLDRLAQRIIDAQRSHQWVALIFVDLDDFKKINDSMGHDVGDALLVEAAQRLRSAVRSVDTVGRLGGDEFVVMLAGISDVNNVRNLAESLLAKFREPFQIDQREMILTLSAGIAIYPDDGQSAYDMLRNADSAMYHAKDLGRNTFAFFTQSMNEEVTRRLQLEEQMHGALERGEFSVVYQPKFVIQGNRLEGAEALLRWHNPSLGNVPPDDFIPVAEQNGQIIQLGRFVLAEALSMANQWRLHNPAFQIAVNLSPRQFRDPQLVDSIQAALAETGFPGEQLELEITEGVLMSGHSYIQEALLRLHDMQILISMDDFGTGFSSLSYLRRFPFDVLKVDRDFVSHMDENPADLELVSAVVAMGHGLGLKIVAEGVETADQLKILASLNCDIAQGFYFSQPVGADEFSRLVQEKWRPRRDSNT